MKQIVSLVIVSLVIMVSIITTAECADEIKFVLNDRPVNRINRELFGQFLERASFGESGPEEALVPGTSLLQPKIMSMLKQMDIPLIRFPGGSDIDYINWHDMVSNVPGRPRTGRPVTTGISGKTITNKFGYDEYFALRDTLGCQTIIVVNFLDALLKRKPLDEAATHVAGLAAYCNAAVGVKLPAGMIDWPAIRKQNGHAKPFNVSYFQIGNEWFGYPVSEIRKNADCVDDSALARWYVTCILAYVDKIHLVDPTIECIIDANMGDDTVSALILADKRIQQKIRLVAMHHYKPGPMNTITLDGKPVSIDKLSPKEQWNLLVSMPGNFDEQGVNQAYGSYLKPATSLGYKIAATEWNWNGWGWNSQKDSSKTGRIGYHLAAAVGVATFINGLIRQGDDIALATQSMLIGNSWDIAAIRYDSTKIKPPHYSSQARVTTFFNQHHGTQRLELVLNFTPRYAQTYGLGWTPSEKAVAYLDAVATADSEKIYIHAVNRNFDTSYSVSVHLKAFKKTLKPVAAQFVLSGSLEDTLGKDGEYVSIAEQKLTIKNGILAIELPARSVSIVEIRKSGSILKREPVKREFN